LESPRGPRSASSRGCLSFRTAAAAGTLAVGLTTLALLGARWLDILPLGPSTALALGLDLTRSRLVLFALTAVLTAAATLAVGPLTFIGLMAPHLAAQIGLRRAFPQMVGAVLLGSLIMVSADWLGRMVLFPHQIPAGLVATLIGGPALMWLLARRKPA